MDIGFRTPLLDFFRRGEVAQDIRLAAAQGALAPRAHEQVGLLVLLVDDPEPEIARTAEATLASIPRGSLGMFLARADVSPELRAFFVARGIEPAAAPAPDLDQPLLDTGPPADASDDGTNEAAPEGSERVTVLQKIGGLSVAQRVALAMKGTREERAILIRDPNKIVAAAVLSSPKISESEIESIAKTASISDEILRIIANTRAWVKSYAVVLALTKNPKTPVAISMNLLARLTENDLRMLSTDRNVPDIVRLTARKKLAGG